MGWQHALVMSLPRNGYSKVSPVSQVSAIRLGLSTFHLLSPAQAALRQLQACHKSRASDTCTFVNEHV